MILVQPERQLYLMKNKTVLIILVIIFVGLIVFLIKRSNHSELELEVKEPLAQCELSEAKTDYSGLTQDISDPVRAFSSNSNSTRKDYRRSLAYLSEQEAQGLHVGDKPKEGMIKLEEVVEVASQHTRNTSNTNKPPSVILVGDFYVVTYEKYKDPFLAGKPHFDCRIGIDAWTGEYISLLRSGGGIIKFQLSKKTGAGVLGENPQTEIYQKKLFNSLKTLTLRCKNSHPLESVPQLGMIPPDEAVKLAVEQVQNRNYDQQKAPWAILVDDVYIVIFWKSRGADIPDGMPIYDSRVGLNAHTGEYIGMEITKDP